MSISTKTILPSVSLFHIGVMVFFMSLLVGSAGFGYISVSHIVQGWQSETSDKLIIEILPYNENKKTILGQDDVKESFKGVLKILDGDPIIKDVVIHRPENETELDLPTSIFLDVSLRADRALNAEGRIIKTIQNNVKNISIRLAEEWEKDIEKTAAILKISFSVLGLAVLFVTMFVMSGVLRTQLKASEKTVQLIHLLGASPSVIQNVFQRAMLKMVLYGSIFGVGVLGILMSPITVYLGISGSLFMYWGILIAVVFLFLLLSFCVTGLTVRSSLREMP